MGDEKKDVKKLTEETIKNGGVLAYLYFDFHGKTEKGLAELAAGFVQKILKENGVVWALGEISKPEKTTDDLFSTGLELKVLTKDLASLTNLCAMYSPFSVDVVKPEVYHIEAGQLNEILMNVSMATFNYKKYIIEKTTTKEDVERFKHALEKRIEMGKRILRKKGEEQ